MDITIHPGKLEGCVQAIPSKSHAHRVLICAALSDKPTQIFCSQTNDDIEATADCLRSLGALITKKEYGYEVTPISIFPKSAELDCRESGSTLRFMLPIIGAMGVDATLKMSGRLPDRPLSPLWEEMERMGCTLSRPTHNIVHCTGKLRSGRYSISGSISSQYITGLMFALSLIPGESLLEITGKVESRPYIDITRKTLADFGVIIDTTISGKFPFLSPKAIQIEGDWSNSAFFLVAGAFSNSVVIQGLYHSSAQGDREIVDLIPRLQNCAPTISSADIPDLVPILAVCAAYYRGAVFTDIGRLRLKESDRVATVCNMLQAFGIHCIATEDTLKVSPGKFFGCTIDAAGDHRIAMAAAIGASIASGDVTILGAQCVNKSYPSFWEVYHQLGGNYEQYMRSSN